MSAQSPKPARIEEAWLLYLNLLQIKKKNKQKTESLVSESKEVIFRAKHGLHSELWLQTYNFHCNAIWNSVEDATFRQQTILIRYFIKLTRLQNAFSEVI